MLPEIVVHAEAGCAQGAIPGTEAEGTDVIAQAIRNAERLLVLEQEYPFVSLYRRKTESLDSLGKRRGSSEGDIASMSRSSYSPGR